MKKLRAMKKQFETIYNEQREKSLHITDEDMAVKKESAADLLDETVKKVRKYIQTEGQANRKVRVWNGSETNPAKVEKTLEEFFIEETYQLRTITRKISVYNLCARFSQIIYIAEELMQNAYRLEEMEK